MNTVELPYMATALSHTGNVVEFPIRNLIDEIASDTNISDSFDYVVSHLESAEQREHMRVDICMLLDCDCIYMLQGWELSKGAKLELDVASSCGIKVLFER